MSNEIERPLLYEEEFIDVSRLDVSDTDVWLYTPIEQPVKSVDIDVCAVSIPTEDCIKRHIDSRTFTRPKKRANRNTIESIGFSTPDTWTAACLDFRNPEGQNINTYTPISSEDSSANHRAANYFLSSAIPSTQESMEAFLDASRCKSADSFVDLTEPMIQDSLMNLSQPSMLCSSIMSTTENNFPKFTESLSRSSDKKFLKSILHSEHAERRSDELVQYQTDLDQTCELLNMSSVQCSPMEFSEDIENVGLLTCDFSRNMESLELLNKDIKDQGFPKDIENLVQLKIEVSKDVKILEALTSEVSKDIESLTSLTTEFSKDIEDGESCEMESAQDIENVKSFSSNYPNDIRKLETVAIEDSKDIENMKPLAPNFSKDKKYLDSPHSTEKHSTFLLEEPIFMEPLKHSTKLNSTFKTTLNSRNVDIKVFANPKQISLRNIDTTFSDKPKEICSKNINIELCNDVTKVFSSNIDTTFLKNEEEIPQKNIDTTFSNNVKEIYSRHVNTTFMNDRKDIALKSKINTEIPDNPKELSSLERERKFYTYVKKSNTKMSLVKDTKCNALKSNLSRLPRSLHNSNSSLSVDSTRIVPTCARRVIPKFGSECHLSELKVDQRVESGVEINSEVDDGLSTCSEGRGSSCGGRTVKKERIRTVMRMPEESLKQNALIMPKHHFLENLKRDPPLSPILTNGLGSCDFCPSSPLLENLPISSSSPLIPLVRANRRSPIEGEAKECVRKQQDEVVTSREVQGTHKAEVKSRLRLPTNWNPGVRSAIPRPQSKIPALRPTRQGTKSALLDQKLQRP